MLIMSSNVWLRSSLIFLILYFSVSRSSSIWQTIKKNFEQERKWQLGHRQKSDWQQWSHMSKTHLINPDVEPLDVHLSLLASVFAHLQLVPEVSRDVENTWGEKQPLLLLAHLQFIHDLNNTLQCTEVFRLCDRHDRGHLNSRTSSCRPCLHHHYNHHRFRHNCHHRLDHNDLNSRISSCSPSSLFIVFSSLISKVCRFISDEILISSNSQILYYSMFLTLFKYF